MPIAYAEYLKANGATDEDIKVLDTAAARKAYDKLAADAEKNAKRAEAAEGVNEEWKKWNVEATTILDRANKEASVAKADKDAAEARVKRLQEEGLIEVAQNQNLNLAPPKNDGIDLANYVTKDTLTQLADREGDAIATVADILDEHRELFGTRLNMRDLRREVLDYNKMHPTSPTSVERLWEQKYNVAQKRTEKVTAEKAVYEKKIAEDAVNKYKSEHLNPDTAPLVPSTSPFSSRAPSSSKDTPWAQSPAEREQARLHKALKAVQVQ